jgi:hypothetical protein
VHTDNVKWLTEYKESIILSRARVFNINDNILHI